MRLDKGRAPLILVMFQVLEGLLIIQKSKAKVKGQGDSIKKPMELGMTAAYINTTRVVTICEEFSCLAGVCAC